MSSVMSAEQQVAAATGIKVFGNDALGALMSKYDKDGNGTFSIDEVRSIVLDVLQQKSLNKQLKKMVCAAFVVVLLLIGALVGTSIAGATIGGEAIKESKVPDCSDSSSYDPRCDPAKMVRVGGVESFVSSVFDLAKAPTEQLAYLRDVTLYVDMSASATVGGVVAATHKIGGAYKRSPTSAFLVTTSGYTIALDADAQSGTITMDGTTYPVSEDAPANGGRALEQVPTVPTMSGRELAQHHENRRALGLFGGSLMTSGSFTMMAAGGMVGTGGRRLDEKGRALSNVFGGSLMTSGSFTMMAAGGLIG